LTSASLTEVAVEAVDAAAYTIATDAPESDGTLEWDSTTIVIAEIRAGGETGLGYTYGNRAIATLIRTKLADVVVGRDPMDVAGTWHRMRVELRNEGHDGHAMMAVSAVDVALWDLKARLLGLPVVALLNTARGDVPVYGSGGFTSYTDERIAEQLAGWVEQGIPRVKMKISRRPEEDPHRLNAARKAIGDEAELFVDANGALSRRDAIAWAHRLRSEWDVRWFEEPVSSDDVEGLRLVRDHRPGGLEVAAGEYGYAIWNFRRWVDAVDCLQADVTRCGGFTGILDVAGLCRAHDLDLSGHCAPQVSAHVLCAVGPLRHLEYFHDHVRIERMLFDGTLEPRGGRLRPDRSRDGLGLELKRADAERYRVG
jgi:L-alanine-DL-glutamate epimerase-like enolase superfamily enzyme